MKQTMKLSTRQIFWMLITMALGVTLLLTIEQTIRISRQDAWISVLFGGVISIWAVFVAVKLSSLFPNQTFVEYTQVLLGKWLGKAVLVLYFAQWYSVTGVILREFSELMNLIMPRTPTWAISCAMLLVVVYATALGIEVIGRCSEFIGPLAVFIVVIALLLSINNVNTERVLPIYTEIGFWKIIQGSIPSAGFIGQNVIIMMLIAFLPKPKGVMSKAIWGTFTAAILASCSSFFVIALFGITVPEKMWFPFYHLITVISVADFIQNVDIIFVLIWLASFFMRLSLIFFAASYGIAQFLKLTNWRKTMWVNAPIVFVISLLPRSILDSDWLYPILITQRFTLPILIIGIPLLLWIVAMIRARRASPQV
ncbi:MAG: spore germination protein [Paenibacillus sp.]|nr:spore germination protein [Paenibacillus sp.]